MEAEVGGKSHAELLKLQNLNELTYFWMKGTRFYWRGKVIKSTKQSELQGLHLVAAVKTTAVVVTSVH